LVEAVAPADDEADPAAHALHGSALPAPAHEPGAHRTHETAPAPEAEPAAQAAHVEEAVAPVAAENVPAAQATTGAPPPAQ